MIAFIVRRTLQMLLALFGVSIVVFALIQMVDGDPIRIALGTRFDPELYQRLLERSGLDRPLLEQYFTWLGSAVTGDLGVSFRTGQPVTEMVLERLPATIQLALVALLIALIVAIPAGIISAVRSGRPVDYGVTALSQVGVSMPDFWAGVMYILVFSLTLSWLPSAGYVGLFDDPVAWVKHILLPALTVGLISGSIITRFVRSSVVEAANQDYVRTAKAKGLGEWGIIRDHVLPNAWISIVTVVGLQLGFLLGGVVVVETVFAWPGLGRLALTAVESRDFTVLQGAVLYIAAMFLVVNLVVDIVYARLDPRVRIG